MAPFSARYYCLLVRHAFFAYYASARGARHAAACHRRVRRLLFLLVILAAFRDFAICQLERYAASLHFDARYACLPRRYYAIITLLLMLPMPFVASRRRC